MSELPQVRPTSCGHGYLPVDAPPTAVDGTARHRQELYLCEDCAARLRSRAIETKEVRPEPASAPPDAAAEGRRAALADEPRRVPAGMHPRSARARDFLAAYDEAKDADGKPTGGA